jgi:MFS family permease
LIAPTSCYSHISPIVLVIISDIRCRYGRKPAVLVPYFVAGCFSFATACSKDIQAILITRFFAGIFGSAPVTNTGGVLGDIWSPQQRGTAIVGYAFAVVGGPTLGVSTPSDFLLMLEEIQIWR